MLIDETLFKMEDFLKMSSLLRVSGCPTVGPGEGAYFLLIFFGGNPPVPPNGCAHFLLIFENMAKTDSDSIFEKNKKVKCLRLC